MAAQNITVAKSAYPTLVGAQLAVFTISTTPGEIEIMNLDGDVDLWANLNAIVPPTVLGTDCEMIPPGMSLLLENVPRKTGNVVQVLGNNNTIGVVAR